MNRHLSCQEHLMLEIARGNAVFEENGQQKCALCKCDASADPLQVQHQENCQVPIMRRELGEIWQEFSELSSVYD